MSTIHFHASPPIVNLNGTAVDQLLEQRHKLAQALELARSDLEQAAPNGRDWQTARSPETFAEAQAESRGPRTWTSIEELIGALSAQENGAS